MSRLASFARASLLPLALMSAACSKKAPSPPADPLASAPPKAERPQTLVLFGDLPAPRRAWGDVQRDLGPAALLLGSEPAPFFVKALGLDGTLAEVVDGARPFRFVGVVRSDRIVPVVALPVSEFRKARGWLAAKEHGYLGTDDPRVFLRDPAVQATDKRALVLAPGEWLLVGEKGAVDEAAAFLTAPNFAETLPADDNLLLRAAAPKAGIAPFAAARCTTAWRDGKEKLEQMATAEETRRGRPADFGDPKKILGLADGFFGPLCTTIGRFDGLKVVARDEAGLLRLRVESSLGPASDATRDPLALPGDTAAVEALPDGDLVVAARTSDGAGATDLLPSSALGAAFPNLDEAAKKGVDDAYLAFRSARGPWLVASKRDEPALFLRTAIADDAALVRFDKAIETAGSSKSLREALRLGRVVALPPAGERPSYRFELAAAGKTRSGEGSGPTLTTTRGAGNLRTFRLGFTLPTPAAKDAPKDGGKAAPTTPQAPPEAPSPIGPDLRKFKGIPALFAVARPRLFDVGTPKDPPMLLVVGRDEALGVLEATCPVETAASFF